MVQDSSPYQRYKALGNGMTKCELSELAEEMRAAAEQFRLCSKVHERRGNLCAVAVAEKANEVLLRFVAQLEAGTCVKLSLV